MIASTQIDGTVLHGEGKFDRGMRKPQLSVEDLVYVADMLRAIAWVKEDLNPASPEALYELEESLGAAESALRRIAAEMNVAAPARQKSN